VDRNRAQKGDDDEDEPESPGAKASHACQLSKVATLGQLTRRLSFEA
jgi:hypothetical protein